MSNALFVFFICIELFICKDNVIIPFYSLEFCHQECSGMYDVLVYVLTKLHKSKLNVALYCIVRTR